MSGYTFNPFSGTLTPSAPAAGPDVSQWPTVFVDGTSFTVGTSIATVVFSNVAYDKTSSGAYSTSTGKFTVPAGQAGVYEIVTLINSNGQVTNNFANSGSMVVYVGKNANAQEKMVGSDTIENAGVRYSVVGGSVKLYLAVGDTVYLGVLRGGNVNAYNIDTGAPYTWMTIARVG